MHLCWLAGVLVFTVTVASVFAMSSPAPVAVSSVEPVAVATWKFGSICVEEASRLLSEGSSAIDAVERSIALLELDQADQYFVGIGGLPNANGKMEFDAAMMDSRSRYGAVMALPDTRNPISVARTVMEKCIHNVLVGDGALEWAKAQGLASSQEDVLTEESRAEWLKWKNENENEEQAAADKGDQGDKGDTNNDKGETNDKKGDKGHDTVGMICLDKDGKLACGTSTSGWKFKHAGRVGDAPLVGSGLFCDGAIGAAVCTGDGEEIMRTCLAFLVVEYIRIGLTVGDACAAGIKRLIDMHPTDGDGDGLEGPTMYERGGLTVGVVAMDAQGNVGAAAVWKGGGRVEVSSSEVFLAGLEGNEFN